MPKEFFAISCGVNGFRSTLVIPRLQGFGSAVACHIFGQETKKCKLAMQKCSSTANKRMSDM